ncbi:hypothetical protein [Leeuwenhoekiella sp. MAR_2009_132]|uniref:hypothetical protein n=1 Tax=Leeuwenhoekiella sp. MAR_2009_132 TaxID=1392489 RepID=UPI00049090DF|nr:hypothetical protein [Leeuwenhoekiella sp. MAR_2009_132]
MLDNRTILNDLHCVRFRNSGFKRTMVLSPAAEKSFNRFLIDSLGQNVFLISTALGLDIYYCSPSSKTDFIVKNLWIFQGDTPNLNTQIVQEHHDVNVIKYFYIVVDTLIKHPQLFLSTCKKFTTQYQSTLIKNRLLTLLYSAFESHLHELIAQNKLPYINKVEKLMREVYVPNFENLNGLSSIHLQHNNLN